jgi:hypothetical protein
MAFSAVPWSPAQAASLPNCAQSAATPCFEMIWRNGSQIKMTFLDLSPAPSDAAALPFYITAPQTDSPQGTVPFLHDHVIGLDRPPHHDGSDPGRGRNPVRYHGYFVLCSPLGMSTGNCVATMTTIEGLGTIPLAKTVHGRPLTTIGPVESRRNAAFLTIFDTGGVLIATTP